ncbi:MAG TPA: isoprenylcysteine carboxylmethyltransferase family protein [Nocardioidaceae bacterium]|jgi:protein-S-isoprenylcysteine O-methyltransferase Ste14|nr:isoprenylcysteine carboxylmethyltransferase family protein [Nocardioidaceae bacterium]
MRPPPPALAILSVLAQRALTRGAQPPTAARVAAASGIAAVSGALAAAAAREFRGQGTTFDPFDPARASVLVTTGANAVSRNPMYVGMAGLLVANAVRRGSWTALLPVVAFALVMDRVQIAAEEGALLARFGAGYESYCATVPRWLGRRSLSPAISFTGPSGNWRHRWNHSRG